MQQKLKCNKINNFSDQSLILVSIIIITYNALEYTKLCIDSINKYTTNIVYELIIVDNGSENETKLFLNSISNIFKNIHVIFNDTNKGFASAVNIGIKNSSGRYILLLNNDTIVTNNWLLRLVENIQLDEKTGIISPITNNVHCGPQLDDAAKDINYLNVENYADNIFSQNRGINIDVPDRLSFFCVLIKKEVFDKIGFLDENYRFGNFEDDDFCIRARMAGFKLLVTKEIFIYHFGGKTFSLNKIDHDMRMIENRKYFNTKLVKLSTNKNNCSIKSDIIRVSVITRTYNRPLKLKQCLDSLTNQTYRDFEVIIINDGGEDVGKIVTEYSDLLNINYIFHKINKGRSNSLNSGIQVSKGDFITYLDDDDIYYPIHLKILMNSLETNTYKVAYTDANKALYRTIAGKNDLLDIQQYASWEFNRDELLVHNLIPNLTLMHAKECVKEIGIVNKFLPNHEDYDFLIRLSQKYDFLHIPIITCEYRFYEGMSNSVVGQRKLMLKTLIEVHNKYPSPNKFVIQRRKELLYHLKYQIKKINEIEKSNSKKEIKEYKILKLTTGLYPPEYQEKPNIYSKIYDKFNNFLKNHGYIRYCLFQIVIVFTKIKDYLERVQFFHFKEN